ncbi:unnamed protein product [Microthlaspi erraticum]|uniref:Importin subunit alpha n=1 Tax=Microthlaspi erraticum TaxID=1685480 RepID=A0A6D2IUG2_9BRAS|nr:unnamed protein product [Microthlaspi erraticum]
MVAGVWSDDPSLQLRFTTEFRKLLIVGSGVLPRFVEFLKKGDNPQLQFEAAWVLTNIASGTSDHVKVLINLNVVPIFVHLIASPRDDVREQVVWALGNLLGDSPQNRDFFLRCGALKPILNQLNDHPRLSMSRTAAWTLSNMCRGKPEPIFEQVKEALPALERLIHSDDEEVLKDACWALSYLSSDQTNNDNVTRLKTIIESGVVPRLVQLLLHPSPSVRRHAIRVLGNIIANGNDEQVLIDACLALSDLSDQSNIQKVMRLKTIIESGAVPRLVQLLLHPSPSVRGPAIRVLRNIVVNGNDEQTQLVISSGALQCLTKLLTQDYNKSIQKECCLMISNLTASGNIVNIQKVVDANLIAPMIHGGERMHETIMQSLGMSGYKHHKNLP